MLLITCVVITSISAFTILSSAGKIDHTGSPADGGATCSAAGCHNGGTATPSVTITAMPACGTGNTYTAGTTYSITVACSGGYPKYGFGLEILNSNTSTGKDAGTFGAVVTTNNCKKVTTANRPTNIVHIPYTPGSSNTAAFVFTWTAPSSGTAYLYCAVNGVNNNGTTSGDKSTTTTLTLTQSTTAIASIDQKLSDVSIFPNPAKEYATVSYILKENSDVTIKLYDISGKNVSNLPAKNQQAGEHKQTINLSELNLESGIYSATIKTGDNTITKRLIIN